MPPSADRLSLVDSHWRALLETELRTGEYVVDWCELDLNSNSHYAAGIIVLTNERLLASSASSVEPDRVVVQATDRYDSPAIEAGEEGKGHANPCAADTNWISWNLDSELDLQSTYHGGVGTLQLADPLRRLAYWRFTAGRSPAVNRLVQQFAALRHGPVETTLRQAAVCPSCGAAIDSADGVCSTCAPTAAPPPISSLYRLIGFAHSQHKLIAFGFLLTLVSTAAGLIPPYLTMPLLDKVLIPHQNGKPVDQYLVFWYLSGLTIAAIVAWLLDWGRMYVLSCASERISADMRSRTYAHLQWLSLEFFGGKRTGDLMSRVGSDTDRLCNFLSLNLVDFATDVILIVMTAGVLFWIDPVLALVTLVPFPFIVWLTYWVRARLQHSFRQSSVAWGAMTSVLADAIPGIRVVKAFAQERREIERFQRANDVVLRANDRVNVIWSFFGPVATLLTEAGLLVVWGYGAWLVFRAEITVGVLTAFVAYISRFYARTDSMIRMAAATQRAAAAAFRIFEILDRVPSVAEPVKPVHPGRLEGRIELRDVRFKYGTREVLHGISLSIEPGEMIGLVGVSGAGKSTLVNLICRFYDVSAGAVTVDDIDIRSFPVAEYRHNIGIVLQDPFLFYGTVAENIAYGRPDATRNEIVAAARAAWAHDFILRLTDGYDSLVGERGQSLSGGERQRISIARALLIDPQILILDEATSSVDTETEREIQAALDNLTRGRTTIAIAHRLSTLRKADRLVVLEQGQITEVGRHDSLLRSAGPYARLHRAQLETSQDLAIARQSTGE